MKKINPLTGKDSRGRKPLPEKEKQVVVTIFVKAKHLRAATKDAAIIELKYKV
jgi:hypothetical protein